MHIIILLTGRTIDKGTSFHKMKYGTIVSFCQLLSESIQIKNEQFSLQFLSIVFSNNKTFTTVALNIMIPFDVFILYFFVIVVIITMVVVEVLIIVC